MTVVVKDVLIISFSEIAVFGGAVPGMLLPIYISDLENIYKNTWKVPWEKT